MNLAERFNRIAPLSQGKRLSLLVVALLTAVIAYTVFIWPTPYIIVHEKGVVFRINRFTGVREESTERGWMTKAQLSADRKLKADEKDAADRAKSQQILEELKEIRVEDARNDFGKIDIHNPTDWQLSNSTGFSQDTVVEYYRGKESFLCKVSERITS